jgi:glycosyltransferase involved in cell wall biosynthesis
MLVNENIICISWLVWDSIPLVMHEMMKRLARQNRVLFVDPPVAYSTVLLEPALWKNRWEKTRLWLKGVRKVGENLYIYYPPPLLLQIGHFNFTDTWSQKITTLAIAKVARQLRLTKPILWIYHPYAIVLGGQFDEKLVCYDCNDDVGFFYTELFPYKRKKLSRMEEALAKKADIIFATSKNLFRLRSSQNIRSYYFPSGIDFDTFHKSLSTSLEMAPELSNVKRPIIGFIGGMVNAKMNWKWIKKASEARPNWSFVFIGPCLEKPDYSVTEQKNVIFLGSKNLEDLPRYVKAFDVCIVPYRGKEFLKNCFPTKVFEYLAAGRPVVSSHIPALEEYQHLVKLSATAEDFISNLEFALQDGLEEKYIQARIAVAKGKTWDSRVEKTTQKISTLLSRKDQLN